MELTNDFEVEAPVERVWAVLTDVERIAPCLPGAQLEEVEGVLQRPLEAPLVPARDQRHHRGRGVSELHDGARTVDHEADQREDGRLQGPVVRVREAGAEVGQREAIRAGHPSDVVARAPGRSYRGGAPACSLERRAADALAARVRTTENETRGPRRDPAFRSRM